MCEEKWSHPKGQLKMALFKKLFIWAHTQNLKTYVFIQIYKKEKRKYNRII